MQQTMPRDAIFYSAKHDGKCSPRAFSPKNCFLQNASSLICEYNRRGGGMYFLSYYGLENVKVYWNYERHITIEPEHNLVGSGIGNKEIET